MKNIIAILTTTNIVCMLYLHNEYSDKNRYKEELNEKNKTFHNLRKQYLKLEENLEELAIKMKNNDFSDIDKHINFGCPKCKNNKNISQDMESYIWGTYSCCKSCLRCANCGYKLSSNNKCNF
jgi:hypothetical protein